MDSSETVNNRSSASETSTPRFSSQSPNRLRASGTVTAFGENWYSNGDVRGRGPGAGVLRRNTKANESSLRMAPDNARSTRARANGPAGYPAASLAAAARASRPSRMSLVASTKPSV